MNTFHNFKIPVIAFGEIEWFDWHPQPPIVDPAKTAMARSLHENEIVVLFTCLESGGIIGITIFNNGAECFSVSHIVGMRTIENEVKRIFNERRREYAAKREFHRWAHSA